MVLGNSTNYLRNILPSIKSILTQISSSVSHPSSNFSKPLQLKKEIPNIDYNDDIDNKASINTKTKAKNSNSNNYKTLPLRYLDETIYKQMEPNENDQIFVAISSGVDSSVTAALLKQKYKNIQAIYMANWSQTSNCIEKDWNDVQDLCQFLNIPCKRLNFEKDYWFNVFEPMIEMYKNGLTPNPDIYCNQFVKFGKLFNYLDEYQKNHKPITPSSNWWLATGHYARIMNHIPSNQFHLLRSLYPNKDQSFYLSKISPSILNHLLLPVGHYSKTQIRQLAKDFNLPTASKPDSQGLCFVNPSNTKNGKFRKFLNDFIQPKPGNIITKDGTIFGQHQGLWHGTIGQKSGISMPQGNQLYKGVWYISEKRIASNELVIVKGGDNVDLFTNTMIVKNWTWMGNDLNFQQINQILSNKKNDHELCVQYISLQKPLKISNFNLVNNKLNEIQISLTQLARAITPGQNMVLYDGNRILGCGIIQKSFKLNL
ncbi:tRNA-5-taurinomethyluridine 2-sulfurtransferase [Ascoidea rubescens DSM 1968]|uniref:tRNA-5-taurinomethyluridine 2-sulfurtransferase n=1 Tax=Ascoidea rubescens DSM 1968 TaxID=1344418 RepID=A0A1D2VQX9_9ASCO|nr:5-methylaminomethyl-2-thiouridylate-methyltransferase [Ascoidea rubescens DSM 1968]ODV64023.1 5-methylaminomethyl-2-thiouridylate-methyltransferase [Ascoidea rubescens DSM 1968]